MTLSLILFDLDETLFDHLHASRSALDALRQDHPDLESIPLGTLAKEAYRILEATHLRVLAGELTVTDARVERLRQLFNRFGVHLDESGYREASAAYVRMYRRSRQPVAGARQVLTSLGTQYTIGVVTNNFREEQESKLEDCGLTDAIDFMVTSEETGTPKPSRAIFDTALELGNARASEAVMVGDSWPVDVVGARNAGIRPVWFNRHGHPGPEDETVDEVRSYEPVDIAVRIILGHN